MAIIRISELEVNVARASKEFLRMAEADIREAHGEVVSRPRLSGIPDYIYEALAHNLDEDLKAYEAEVAEQYRLLNGEDPATQT